MDEVEAVARALAKAKGIEICSDAQYAYSSFREPALAAIAALDAARGKAEPVAWMHHHPKVPDAAFKTPLPRGADELGWTETPLYAHPPAAPDTVTFDRALVEEVLRALGKVSPIRVQDGPDYAEVFFSDGTTHSTQAMTMNPQDWHDLSAALTKLTEALK